MPRHTGPACLVNHLACMAAAQAWTGRCWRRPPAPPPPAVQGRQPAGPAGLGAGAAAVQRGCPLTKRVRLPGRVHPPGCCHRQWRWRGSRRGGMHACGHGVPFTPQLLQLALGMLPPSSLRLWVRPSPGCCRGPPPLTCAPRQRTWQPARSCLCPAPHWRGRRCRRPSQALPTSCCQTPCQAPPPPPPWTHTRTQAAPGTRRPTGGHAGSWGPTAKGASWGLPPRSWALTWRGPRRATGSWGQRGPGQGRRGAGLWHRRHLLPAVALCST